MFFIRNPFYFTVLTRYFIVKVFSLQRRENYLEISFRRFWWAQKFQRGIHFSINRNTFDKVCKTKCPSILFLTEWTWCIRLSLLHLNSNTWPRNFLIDFELDISVFDMLTQKIIITSKKGIYAWLSSIAFKMNLNFNQNKRFSN